MKEITMKTYTKKEVAKILKISTRTVERQSRAGILPKPVYIGARLPRWPAAAVEALINGQVQEESLNASR